MKHFCIDIDNVVAQTDEVLRAVIADFTNNRVRLAYDDVLNFDYCKCKDETGNSITRDEWRAIHDLFSEPRYLWLIRPTRGAIEGLCEVSRHAVVHFATSRLAKARRVTIEWLENHGFPSHDLHFLKQGEKHASLRQFSAAVEDDYDQAKAFATLSGTPCFLLSHPWNRDRPHVNGVTWTNTWQELTARLIEIATT